MTTTPLLTEARIELAFSQLGLREPFIAAVMSRVKREISDSVPTASTNGAWVKFNPVWCGALDNEEFFGLVLHESCHVVLMHPWRREGRAPTTWNVANDALINQYVLSRGYKLPKGGVHIAWVKEDMDSETVYLRLKKEQEQKRAKGGDPGEGEEAGGFDGTGDLEDVPDEASKLDMEATIAAAAQAARDCGHGTSMVDRVLASLGASKTPWQDITRAMMSESAMVDYSYRRPSRRFIGENMYMPSLQGEKMGALAVGFDVSGSIGKDDCDRIAADIRAIVGDLCPSKVIIVYCADRVTGTQVFDEGDELVIKPVGTGGTRFKPVFDKLAQMDERLCGLIYFTDLEGPLAECEEPEYPVVWADFGRSHPAVPFGFRADVIL